MSPTIDDQVKPDESPMYFAVESWPLLCCVRQMSHRKAALAAICNSIIGAAGRGDTLGTGHSVRVVALGEVLVVEFDTEELMSEIGGIVEVLQDKRGGIQ